jgi:hypothetical protein
MAQFNSEKVARCTEHSKTAIKGFFGPYRWLSNFHLCSCVFEGVTYPSSENAYQAAKAAPEARVSFYRCAPNEAKQLGRLVVLDPKVWTSMRLRVMGQILLSKFTLNMDLQQQLLGTGAKYLEETNWWNDRYWGVCDGTGENQLGRILMDIRTELQRKMNQGGS